MKFSEVIDQASELLQRKGRITYRSLKLEFDLDDERLDVLKEELIEGQRVARDENGKVLVWSGDGVTASQTSDSGPRTPDSRPASYTPKHLAERILAEQAAMESRGHADGERKTITALFADLKGSTALIEGLDPEEARAIIDPALQLMMDAVHRYDGYVAQALGDGIFALFGAPIAHEDHPQRALYAALRMQEEMRRYADTLREQGTAPLQMRVGVNTGEVVVRSIRKDDLHTDYVPVGHSTNIAARMEQLANPGSILVTEQTHRLTEGYFEFSALGKTKVKGIEDPVPIYEVTGAGPLRTRLQVAARRGLTRFVGRQSEMEQMRQALAQAKEGHGQIVGVIGEPGVGKSRLFYEFKLTSLSGCLVLEAFSVSYGKASPYLPIIDLLKTYFQIQPRDDERTRREKIAGKVLILDRSLEDTLPYLFSLLGIEEQNSSLQQMDAQMRRRRTFEALKKLFLRESLNQPLILIFEDLHWIDTETQGFLDMLSEGVASAKVLLLVNYRPEYRHEWGGKMYYSQLRLTPLGKEEAEELLSSLLGKDTTLTALKQLILEKTEGTPFFMEEVVQTLAEEGALNGERGNYRLETTPTELHISPTVQGVLAARIDRLSAEEKGLLQQLSVIGRQFPLGLVKQVVRQPEEEVYRVLSSLQAKEFLYEQPAFPEVEYIFKHVLTQEVAYGTVLQELRKVLHEQTAQAIEVLYSSSLEEHYSELAHHYSRSGNTEKAVEYLGLAGQQAARHSANEEAVRHLTTALDFLSSLPDTPERNRRELDLQATLAPVLILTSGYGNPQTEKAYARAKELCEQVGETPRLFPVLWGFNLVYYDRGEYQTARRNSERMLALAQQAQDSALLVEAHYGLGAVLFQLGEFLLARTHLEQGISLYHPQKHRHLAFEYALDPAVSCRAYLGLVLWALGYPDQAYQRAHEAIVLAQELAHSHSQAMALGWGCTWLHQFLQDAQGVRTLAEDAIALCREKGFPFQLGWSTILRGWALAAEGQAEEGIEQVREGTTIFQASAGGIFRQSVLVLSAEAYRAAGYREEASAKLAEVRATLTEEAEHCYEAELHRLTGELTLESNASGQVPRMKEAEACFCEAIKIARRQQAKSWELRASTSLARLWQQQGKKAEAHNLLSEIYNWFTEGFDTKDLKEAKALLDELVENKDRVEEETL